MATSYSLDQGQDKRAEVVTATLRVIARDGLDKASMRAIAHELGCSTGVLTHYFRDKEAMLDVVLSEIISATEKRRFYMLTDDPDIDRYVDYICELLPNSEAQIQWWKVWLAFTIASFVGNRKHAGHHRFYASIRASWGAAFRQLILKGLIRDDLDPFDEADALLALLDGLGVQILISPNYLTFDRQQRIVRNHFNRLRP